MAQVHTCTYSTHAHTVIMYTMHVYSMHKSIDVDSTQSHTHVHPDRVDTTYKSLHVHIHREKHNIDTHRLVLFPAHHFR